MSTTRALRDFHLAGCPGILSAQQTCICGLDTLLVALKTEAYGEGQERAIRDVNAGVLDDKIRPRLRKHLQEARHVTYTGEVRDLKAVEGILLTGCPHRGERLAICDSCRGQSAQLINRLRDLFTKKVELEQILQELGDERYPWSREF